MKAKFEITEKDKKLLVFMTMFVIIVCFGYYGIFPAVMKNLDITSKIADEEDKKSVNDMKIMELPLIESDNDVMREEIEGINQEYFDVMTSDQIDKYFTNMVLDYNIYAYDLIINMPKATTKLEPYKYSEKYIKSNEEGAEKVSIGANNGIYTVEVTMRVGGKQEDLEKLIDDLSNTDLKIRLSRYFYTTEKDVVAGDNGTYQVNEISILNMTVELYMCAEK